MDSRVKPVVSNAISYSSPGGNRSLSFFITAWTASEVSMEFEPGNWKMATAAVGLPSILLFML